MLVRVRVTPNGKRERVTKIGENWLHIVVREPAERNMANLRVRELVAQTYAVPMHLVHIQTGHKSPTKVYTIGEAHR